MYLEKILDTFNFFNLFISFFYEPREETYSLNSIDINSWMSEYFSGTFPVAFYPAK